MKKLFTFMVAVFLTATLWAQSPEKMSYQAVIRNSSEALVTNTTVGMQISILQGSASGTAVYVETQSPTTNANGLISIKIGDGTVQSGDFTNIEWANGPYFIKTETDPAGGTDYTITGTSQLLSVPYALHAQTAESANETDPEFNAWDKSTGINIDKEQVNGLSDYIETESDPVFEQSAASGITETDTENWNNKLDEESDPVFGVSPAASITEADKERWNSREEFSGSYTDLSDTPENLSDFTNDVGYQLRSEDEDTSPTNEIQHLFAKSNNKIGLSGSGRFVDIPSLETDPDFNASVASGITATDTTSWNNKLDSETDPDFNASVASGITATDTTSWNNKLDSETDPVFSTWDKSTGISITESQISDLDHFTTADETDPVYDASVASGITATDTTSWNNKLDSETDPSVPIGTQIGEMQYWNGTAWVTVAATENEGATLQMIGGIPTWVGGTAPTPNVTNPTTGEIWMDRNLGASQVATSSTDANAYGDLYQWGRAADGHESRTSATTSTNATSAVPNDGNAWDGFFITEGSSPYDWLTPQDDNLWQGVSGTNNPCPSGYRLPTEAEWEAERTSWSSNNAAGAFASPLKLPVAGYRYDGDGSLGSVGSNGRYWSSTVDGTNSRYLGFNSSNAGMYSNDRADGNSVRCLKD